MHQEFGDMTFSAQMSGGGGSSTRGILWGGNPPNTKI